MVVVEQLTKSYGTCLALDRLCLAVPRGEIIALVGPNGAGKTTALKLMAGLLTPTSGRVTLAGHDVHRQPLEAKRFLSFVPDQPFLYEQLTVAELLGFIGGVYQMPPEHLQARANALSQLFGLDGMLAQRISALSYGMKSRVVLMASLLHDPQVLIMDEPFFGLDPQTLRVMKQLLVARAKAGMTVIVSTHQLPIVEDVAHRIAIMASGRVIALGTLEALKQQHRSSRLEELFFQLTSPPPADSASA